MSQNESQNREREKLDLKEANRLPSYSRGIIILTRKVVIREKRRIWKSQ